MAKKPKLPYPRNVVIVEDVGNVSVDRGWKIAAGRTARIVDINADPKPADAVHAIAEAHGKKLPVACLVTKSGKVATYRENSFEV